MRVENDYAPSGYRSLLWELVETQCCVRDTRVAATVLTKCLQDDPAPVSVSYKQLIYQVARIVNYLQTADYQSPAVGEPVLVGICIQRSLQYVAAVLACLQTGSAFLPLEPAWPAARLKSIVDDAKPKLVLVAADDNATLHHQHGLCMEAGSAQLECSTLDEHQLKARQGTPTVPVIPISGPSWVQVPPFFAGDCSIPDAAAATPAGPGISARARDRPALPWSYVMYTSGSTGQPCGVRGTEEGILNRCRWHQSVMPLDSDSAVCFKTSPCFVDSIWELFAPLLAGARMVIAPPDWALNPAAFVAQLAQEQVTHLTAVPAVWHSLMPHVFQYHEQQRRQQMQQPDQQQQRWRKRLALRLAVSSGAPLPTALQQRLMQVLPSGCVLWNLYGSTEVAADCTWFDATGWQPPEPLAIKPPGKQAAAPDATRPGSANAAQSQGLAEDGLVLAAADNTTPVGWPIAGTAVIVTRLQDAISPTAVAEAPAGIVLASHGEVGEVLVVGAGLAAGIHRQPRLEAARFACLPASTLLDADPISDAVLRAIDWQPPGQRATGLRACKTGDLGMITAEHGLEICGRLNLQVKVRGMRVDLLEVEHVLAGHLGVKLAACRAWPHSSGRPDLLLAAYVEPAPTAPPARHAAPDNLSMALQAWCCQRLAPEAVPASIRVLAPGELPVSPAGKPLRSALPSPSWLLAKGAVWRASAAAHDVSHSTSQAPRTTVAPLLDGVPVVEPGAVGKDPRGSMRKRSRTGTSSNQAPSAAARCLPSASPARPVSIQPHASALESPVGSTGIPGMHGDFPHRADAASAPSEAAVLGAFAAALGAPRLEPTSDFFLYGGDSLAAAEAAGWLGLRDTRLIAAFPTARKLAAHLGAAAAELRAEDARWLKDRCAPTEAAKDGVGGSERVKPGVVPQGREAPNAATWPMLEQLPPAGDASIPLAGQLAPDPVHKATILTCGAAAQVYSMEETASSTAAATASAAGSPVTCLSCAWRAKFMECVDAAPVVVIQEPQGGRRALWWVLACSHGGDVACLAGDTGACVWQACLPDRADSGLAVTPDLKVVAAGCADGRLYLLSLQTGQLMSSCDCGGAIKAAPAVDPWAGDIWCASHGRRVVVCSASGETCWTHELQGAVSAPVVFDAQRGMAYVVTLTGVLHAFSCTPGDGAVGLHAESERTGFRVRLAWARMASGPTLTGLAVDPSSGLVVFGLVSGAVEAVTAQGDLLWRHETHKPLYAPLCLIMGHRHCHGAVPNDDSNASLGSIPKAKATPACRKTAGPASVLVACHNGELLLLNCSNGDELKRMDLGAGPLSTVSTCMLLTSDESMHKSSALQHRRNPRHLQFSPLADGPLPCTSHGAAPQLSGASQLLGASVTQGMVCCHNGGIAVLDGGFIWAEPSTAIICCARLPGEIFSAPVAFDGKLLVGCRDDHLYCISVT